MGSGRLPRLFVLMSLGMLAACRPLWQAANRAQLEADLSAILTRSGAQAKLSDCHMLGTTRTATCDLAIEPDAFDQLAQGLDMAGPYTLLTLPTPSSAFLVGDAGCLAEIPGADLEHTRAYLLDGRPAQLALANGGQFEYLLIAQVPDLAHACLQVSYAYG
jgi:hypothetical protein